MSGLQSDGMGAKIELHDRSQLREWVRDREAFDKDLLRIHIVKLRLVRIVVGNRKQEIATRHCMRRFVEKIRVLFMHVLI